MGFGLYLQGWKYMLGAEKQSTDALTVGELLAPRCRGGVCSALAVHSNQLNLSPT